METARARRIADSFAYGVALSVRQVRCGLLVQHRHGSRYFSRESCFRAYLFSLAGLPQRQSPNRGCGQGVTLASEQRLTESVIMP
jgi:hypothetical protein